MSRRIPYFILVAVIVALDLFTKHLILQRFRLHESLTVIPNFFDLVYVRNYGAAFGLGNGASSSLVPLLLTAGAIGVFIFVVFYSFRLPVSDRLMQTALHLVMGGAIGNLVDRFRFGYVVDFLDFYVVVGGQERHWPAFNIADSAITVGIVLLMLDMFRKPSQAEEPA